MSTMKEVSHKELLKGKKRGIKDIPQTIKAGMRMTQKQQRFCIFTAVAVIVILFAIMTITENKATNTVTINEEAWVLQDASTAERILAVDGKNIAFQEGYTWSGQGTRTILNEKIATSKNYWVTLGTDEEIAKYNAVVGEGRFIPLQTIENNSRSLWVMMGTDDEIKKIKDAVEGAAIVQISNKSDTAWLQQGTDAENQAAEEAFNNITFIQFERLGNTHIRLRRGTETEIEELSVQKINYRKLRLLVIFLLAAAACMLAFGLKSPKITSKPQSFQKMFRTGALLLGIILLGCVVFLTAKMDTTQDQLTRISAVIMPVDGEEASAEDEDLPETVASDQKFSFVGKEKGNPVKTVTIPREAGSQSGNRIVQYVMLALLGLMIFILLYLFRYERDLGFPMFNTVILIILMLITVYPVLNTLATSFNDGTDAVRGGIGVLPRKFSMKSYDNILSKQEIFDAAWVSASKTVIITILNLFWTGMLAYALSRREYVLRKFITTLMVLTMYVNAGLIPGYLLISQTLNLSHTYWVYIIPTMFSCFNMIVIRTYIAGLPDALVESAKIDGAGDFRIYWKIIFPLCTPVLATVALFVAVGSWNSWFDTRLYNAGQKDPKTLQYLLQMKILTAGQNSNAANTSTDALVATSKVEPITIRAAITVISTVPILVVYPFLQKYFVTGMALGSVKG